MSNEPAPKRKGTFLLAHGLNIAPRAMDWIGAAVREQGHATVFTSLAGHDGIFRNRTLASSERWKKDFSAAFSEAENRGGPLTVLGYSLGGLLSALAIEKGIVKKPDKLVLLSPAIGLRSWVRIFEPLPMILPGTLPLPSGVPARYRAARFAAVSWYRVLFELYRELWATGPSGPLRDLPIRIYISARDEFISAEELLRWRDAAQLSNVKVTLIESKARVSPTPQHLLLEPEHFGEGRWKEWIEELTEAKQ
jgi:hypothetical protein